MIVVISPAKSLDFENRIHPFDTGIPPFQEETLQLVKKMQSLSKKKLKDLMSISDNLAEQNYLRYKEFSQDYTEDNSKAALLAFTGDVYQGIDARSISPEALVYAKDHLIILSGLYGALKPTDRIQPYRLEMGTSLKVGRKPNLVHYWKDKVTSYINEQLLSQQTGILLNLASKEYFNAIDRKNLKADIIDVDFKEMHQGKLKMISFNAKKARGLMTRYVIQNKVKDLNKLKSFHEDGYLLDEVNSTDNRLLFTR